MSAHPHVLPLRVYFAVFFGLLGMTALTTWVAYADLGPLNTAVAIAIAGLKTLMVVMYFMHVRYSSRLIGLFAAGGFLWLLLLIGLTLADYQTRASVPAWG